KLAPVLCQQARHEHRKLERDVKGDTIGQHAEPPDRRGILVETSCTGGSAPPGDLLLCPRVCTDGRYAANDGFTLAEKTSMGQPLGDAPAQVLAIGIHVYLGRPGQAFKSANGGHDLHAVVGGSWFSAVNFPPMTAKFEDGPPPSRARIG